MTVYLISSNVTTNDFQFDAVRLTAAGDEAYVLQGVTVAALGPESIGIYGGFGNHSVDLYGTVLSARDAGIFMNGGNNRVFVSETGTVSGGLEGVYLDDGSSTLINAGAIISQDGDGIYASDADNRIIVSATGTVTAAQTAINDSGGSGSIVNDGALLSTDNYGVVVDTGNNDVVNNGDITSHSSGIYALGVGNKIVNNGTIITTGPDYAIQIVSLASGQPNKVVNTGDIFSEFGILGGNGSETVTNRGLIDGDVNLGAGADTYNGEGGVVVGNVLGGDGNDTLLGGSFDDFLFGGNNNDDLRGRGEDDVLNGGAGKDTMRGGLGLDVYDYDATSDSAVGANRDVITRFEKGSDTINVATIDANLSAANNQAFKFIGSSAFTQAGQLRAFTSGSNTFVEGSVDGDTAAEFQIQLTGNVAVTADDFIA